MKLLFSYFSSRFLPRWVVLLFDLSVIPVSYFLAYLLRFNFELRHISGAMDVFHLAIILPVFTFCYWKSKSYSGIIRLSTAQDVLRILSSVLCAGLLLVIISTALRLIAAPSDLVIPYSVIIILILLASTFLIISRLLAKLIFQLYNSDSKKTCNVMIFGAGQLGQITRNALLTDSSANVKIVGFIDDNESLHHKYMAGIPVYPAEKAFEKIIQENDVTEIIFAIDKAKISLKRKREITDECIKRLMVVKEVPPVKTWMNGELSAESIKKIKIEDLLGRDSIQLDRKKIETGIKDSTVLVTGAAGSIGSEIVRQLIGFNVKKVILLDKAESDLFNLEQEILAKFDHANFDVIVGDITNMDKLRNIFVEYSPSIVFNAAAYKHVPLMEKYPCEAIRVNVGGTKNLADLSVKFGVEKFVFISTDKAVNPTNVMGASKRISEIYIQSLVQSNKFSTRFVTTRFGNVLGSNGSVVPLFKKQIKHGGPVTVTHKDITRYFMTIPEACQLVLEAGFMGKGGEIFVFDMGEPVRIYDLAEKMISLSGFIPHKDIRIKITNLRPGEKLFEELLDNKEELMPTYNDKIMIGKVRKHEYQEVNKKILGLLQHIDQKNRNVIVEEMMNIVPEYIPMNSYCFPVNNQNQPIKTPFLQQ